VGSRGGHGKQHSDDPEFWSARSKAWKADHPEYRERERQRSALRRARQNDDRPEILFTDVIRSLMSRASAHQMGRELAVDHSAVWRICRGEQVPSGETIDAVVARFGQSEVIREWRRLRAVSREGRAGLASYPAGSTSHPSPDTAP